MSELINNREQSIPIDPLSDRLSLLFHLFSELYNGVPVEQIKSQFIHSLGKITIEEAAQLSQYQHSVLEQRELSDKELQRLASAHLSILEGRIEAVQHPQDEPGHPIHTFKLENRAVEALIQSKLEPNLELFQDDDSLEVVQRLIECCNLLWDLDKHYGRKEQLVFPYLEKYGINGPSNNMWRIDDYIRAAIKEAKQMLTTYYGNKKLVTERLLFLKEEIQNMIYREETILFPMTLKILTEDEWIKIAHESDEIGFCLTIPAANWKPDRKELDEKAMSKGFIKLETGILSLQQLELILNHLPVDITFIDHQDIVRYFSHGKERIFPRTKAVIGRTVQNCHPPKSAHIVEALLDDFKSGKKDMEDFWLKVRDKYVYIRYFAVRDEDGRYMGTLEFSQNIGPIQAIEGEKRILS
ncbi:DUF438 domain-containing protein [Paenibacillus tyrfis]|uniref:DUF438 domain-containing protein n=1 Tax=Paenibacillus tyrfis TaxID=1501230 RepID=UPI00209DCBE0|nr:DUF438 domain-containing protein [Paenibacillus tyrfis]MCP1312577.1 DUF438 domain-containing protein [Paenibacillus tyrfis]